MSADNQDFDALLRAVGERRDRAAFVRLFEYFAPRVKSFLMKAGLQPDQADELAQETMLTVWHRAEGFDPAKAAASTWIFTIARNKRIDWLRRRQSTASGQEGEDILAALPAFEPLPDETAIDQQHARALRDALKTLPEEQADIIRRSYFEDKTHDDIAQETGLPLGTVKSRLRLGMDRLKRALGEKDAS